MHDISYVHPLGRNVFIIINGKDKLCKFDAKSDVGIVLGYSSHIMAYMVFNTIIKVAKEWIYVKFNYLFLPLRKIVVNNDIGVTNDMRMDFNLQSVSRNWRFLTPHTNEEVVEEP